MIMIIIIRTLFHLLGVSSPVKSKFRYYLEIYLSPAPHKQTPLNGVFKTSSALRPVQTHYTGIQYIIKLCIVCEELCVCTPCIVYTNTIIQYFINPFLLGFSGLIYIRLKIELNISNKIITMCY